MLQVLPDSPEADLRDRQLLAGTAQSQPCQKAAVRPEVVAGEGIAT